MTLDYITSLTDAGESETLESKETTGTRREAIMTMCAFLNQSGGQVLFKLMTEEVRVGELDIGLSSTKTYETTTRL